MSQAGNLLRQETSPYLLQHAGNPVHWRPWGTAALAEAQATDRPVLLSIGYAACHWCHVMAHESFEDESTAALMNRLYVCVKVDREERPDIDHIYMSALHAMGEQGGWPLTMFLTPRGEPFWGGTYFPPEPRWGRPSFQQVLTGVAEAFRTQHDAIRQNVGALQQSLAAIAAVRPGAQIDARVLQGAADRLLAGVDPIHGGLRGAPKFPNSPIFRFLWQFGVRTGAANARSAVRLLLSRMSQGGIYDHLGGGYARYSTDDMWLAPHFEKMLYDNAQLLELLALAHAEAPDQRFAACAVETVGWMEHDMTAARTEAGAAFAASEDADSEGEEGRFYVWTEAEVDAVLGSDSQLFKTAYDITPAGNWEGRNILRRVTESCDAATEALLAGCRKRLLAARAERVRPGRDDKVLADWNGLAIAALCRAASVFAVPAWLERAAAAFAFVEAALTAADGRCQHAWRLGRVTANGLLDDQAAVARAALALFEVTGIERYLVVAQRLVATAEQWFGDDGESFFATASDAIDVPLGAETRPRIIIDSATPSGNGLMAEVLARLYHLTGEPRYRSRAEAVILAFSGYGDRLSAAPTLLAAADLLENGTCVVITGESDHPLTRALWDVALTSADPAVCVIRTTGTDAVSTLHPAYGKTVQDGSAAAYVCRGRTCSLPVTDRERLGTLLSLNQRATV